MRKFLTHPVVLFALLIVVASILLSGSKTAKWYSWFAKRTVQKNTAVQNNVYVQQQGSDSVVMDVVMAHTKLFSPSALYASAASQWSTVWSVPQYLAASQRVLMTDIIVYLENAPDKEAGVDSLLGQMNYYQNEGTRLQWELQEIIQQYTQENTLCANSKKDADGVFYQWLRDGDASVMLQWLEESKKSWTCQTTSRIDINAHTVMLQRVKDITATLTSLTSLLSQNRQGIIANFSFFKDSYLEKLISLRDDLRARSPWTP